MPKRPYGLNGFSIPPSIQGLLKIDPNNINFEDVTNLGNYIGGDPFKQSIEQDDPSIYMNSILGNASSQYASANNPLYDLTGHKGSTRTILENRNKKIAEQNAASGNAAQDQFASLQSIFNFIGNFKKGGALKMQKGGVPPQPGAGLNTDNIWLPSKYDDLSFKIEDKLQDKYYEQAWQLKEEMEEERGEHFSDEEWDTIRHAATSMFMTAGQGPALSPLKMGYSNLMGLIHEIKVGGPVKETVSDLRNNYIGSLIGALPVGIKLKEKLMKKAIDTPKLLSVLYPTPEDIEARKMSTEEQVANNFLIEKVAAEDRGEGHLKSIVKPEISLPQELQAGGKAQLGYSDNSPYKDEPFITIPSGNIDMSKTNIDILGIPDIGEPKIMKKKSGTHIFPEANYVTEIPIMKKGGKKKKIPFYQEGGQPVPTGVQMEDDEIIVTPNLDILDTSAKEDHKDMEPKEVTDIMRPEDYVLSNKLKLTKKEADKMSLGYGAMVYREGETTKPPKEYTVGGMFKEDEKEMTLAEFGKRVRKKLPVTDKEDVFSLKTNDANRLARLPYIAAAVHKNEMKRTKGKPEFEFESAFENPYESSFGAQSGMSDEGMSVMGGIGSVPEMRHGGPKQMQDGGDGNPLNPLNLIGQAINIGTGLYDALFGAPKRKKTSLRALEADDKAINTLAGTQGKFATSATGAALAGYALQDPTVNAPQYDSTQLDARIRKAPRSMWEYAMGKTIAGARPFQESLFANAGSFAQAANAYAPIHAQNTGMLANIGVQEAYTNIGLENTYRDLKQSFNDRQTLTDVTAKNATRTNRNALVAGTAGTISGGITTQGQIESNRQNALRSNNLQKAQVKNNASQQGVEAMYGVGNAVMTLPQDMFQNKPAFVNNNLPPIAPPEIQRPPMAVPQLPLSPLNPIAPYQSNNLPYNYQGSTVPLGPNYQYDPSTGMYYPR